jgi:hypothetical protein
LKLIAGTMFQHDFRGRLLFQHRNGDKWNLFGTNRRVPGFRHEEDCRGFLRELRQNWSGWMPGSGEKYFIPSPRLGFAKNPRVQGVMITCPARSKTREKTLQDLAATDWGELPLIVEAPRDIRSRRKNQIEASRLALQAGLDSGATHILFLEDDLQFNQFIRENLSSWLPFREGILHFGSLYNPGIVQLASHPGGHVTVAEPRYIFGSQAFIISREAAAYSLKNWRGLAALQDRRIAFLAHRLKTKFFYHTPSLVQHVGWKSSWGGRFHSALDYNAFWRASEAD